MKYRLKNREFQAQLDRLSRGDFSRRLDEWNGDRSEELVNFSYGEETGHASFPRTFETAILTADIEEVIPFDPNAWNEWPAVTPPKNVLMRLEMQLYGDETNKSGYGPMTMRECACFDGNGWILFEGNNIEEKALKNRIVRFRPWLSPYEEEKE